MRRFPVLLGSAVMAVAAFTPTQAVTSAASGPSDGVIYTDTGTDPVGDGSSENPIYDIRRTKRTLSRRDGVRYLRIVVRAGADYTRDYLTEVDVALDTRRGPRADFGMRLWLADMDGQGCYVHKGHRVVAKGGLRIRESGAMTCRIAAHVVRPDKQIRWRVSQRYLIPPRKEGVDRAPDGLAWYP